MKALRFWLPLNGVEHEITIPGDYVETVIVPSAEHEAGHIVAAHHNGARVLGIAVGFIPELEQRAMFLQALYSSKGWPPEIECVVKAAGPAADELYFGGYTEQGVSQDLRDIEQLTGIACLEPHLGAAKAILAGYADQIVRISTLLRGQLESVEEWTLGVLPGGHIGTLLLNETQLMQCLGKSRA